MKTVNFAVHNDTDKAKLINHIKGREGQFTVSLVDGVKRSINQNRLQRKWVLELDEQMQQLNPEITPEMVRATLKLHYGVPILREESEAFRLQYDRVIKPLSYEDKLLLMQEPIDFPVTRLMTTKQNKVYLDNIFRDMSGKGFVLTDPNWQGWDFTN